MEHPALRIPEHAAMKACDTHNSRRPTPKKKKERECMRETEFISRQSTIPCMGKCTFVCVRCAATLHAGTQPFFFFFFWRVAHNGKVGGGQHRKTTRRCLIGSFLSECVDISAKGRTCVVLLAYVFVHAGAACCNNSSEHRHVRAFDIHDYAVPMTHQRRAHRQLAQ